MQEMRRANAAMTEAAKEFGVTEREVAMGIELAACDAIITAYRNQDRKTLELWERIPRSGAYPSAYEIIVYLGNEIKGWSPEA